jgi:deazaflavin-dependent oxidoreductase (nitroreductase family)
MTGLGAKLVKALGRLHVTVFRLSRGRIGGRVKKAQVMLLTTTGRKTGAARTTPLLYLRDGERLAVVASFGGSPQHPAWYLNLCAQPEVGVDLGREQFTATARTATPDERAVLWPKLVEMYGGYAGYQLKTTRAIPVALLERT